MGQERVIRIRENSCDVRGFELPDAPIEVPNHVGANVNRIDPSLIAHVMRQAKGKITGACADIGDHLAWLNGQSRQNLVRLLIGVAFPEPVLTTAMRALQIYLLLPSFSPH